MYGPQVGRLGGGREADLAVVARVLEDLADDDPDVLVAERRHAGGVLVAVGDELEQAGGDARLDDADAHAVADRDQAVALGRQLDVVARVDLGQLARVGQVGQEREARSCRSPRRRSETGALLPSCAGTVFSPAATSSILSRSMLRSAMRFVGSSASAVW